MSLSGKYWVHCAVCAKGVQVEAGGQPMLRTRAGMACCKLCADELDLRDARAVLGHDTPSYGTDKWRSSRLSYS